MLGTKAPVFHFADVEVREREFCLIKAGHVEPVEPKAFRVLLFLLHNPQKLITKEELLNAVWGETAVSENSLTRSIALLRKLLGDDTHQSRFIETVATVGYRFICPVEVVEDAHGGLAPEESAGTRGEPLPDDGGVVVKAAPEKTQGKTSWIVRRRWLVGAVFVVVGVFAAGIWYLFRPLPQLRITEYAQIIHDTHQKTPVGTDGARLFFNDYYAPNPLGQSSVSGGVVSYIPVNVPSPTMAEVSPDGSSLLVISDNPGLWSVRILDGSLRRLADDRAWSAAWSADGKFAVYSTTSGDIKVVRSDGTDARKLVTTQERTGRFPAHDVNWSPDGGRIRFTLNYRIWEVSADGSNLHLLLPGWRPSVGECCGRWTPGGSFFVFLSQDSMLGAAAGTPGSQMWYLDERHRLFRKASTEPVQLIPAPSAGELPFPARTERRFTLEAPSCMASWSVMTCSHVSYNPTSGASRLSLSPSHRMANPSRMSPSLRAFCGGLTGTAATLCD